MTINDSMMAARGAWPLGTPPNTATPNTDAAELPTIGLPVWLFQPRGAPTINLMASALVAPLTTTRLITFSPGPGHQLRVDAIGFGSPDPTALPNATFTIQIDGNIVQGYGMLPIAIGTLDEPGSVFVLVTSTGILTIDVTNNFAGSAFTYIIRVRGWTYQEGGTTIVGPVYAR